MYAWSAVCAGTGFGLSYEYMAVALPERHGDAARSHRRCPSGQWRQSVRHWTQARPPPWASPRLTADDDLPPALDPGAVLYLMEIEAH